MTPLRLPQRRHSQQVMLLHGTLGDASLSLNEDCPDALALLLVKAKVIEELLDSTPFLYHFKHCPRSGRERHRPLSRGKGPLIQVFFAHGFPLIHCKLLTIPVVHLIWRTIHFP